MGSCTSRPPFSLQSRRATLLVALLCFCFSPLYARADTSQLLFGLNGIGYFHYLNAPNAHQIAQEKMQWLEQAGAKWDRFDFWWGTIEPQPGVWNWSQADWLVSFYARHHIHMLPILCYQAAWMHQSPHTPEDFAQFADFVGHVVARYHKQIHCWEIWNEPNIPAFWKPHSDAAAYTELLKAAYLAAHKADPHCIIVGAAANETDINWLEAIAEHGGLSYMDAVSIHPYSMSDGPEQMYLAQQLQNVRRFLAAHGRPNLPIWITEMGWTSSIENLQSMRHAAIYLVQSYTIAAAEGVQHLFWFSEQDWTEGGKLQGWGLLSPDMHPKLTFDAYRQIASFLDGCHFVGYVLLENGIGYLFRKGRTERLIAWAYRGQTALLPPLRPHAQLIPLFATSSDPQTGSGLKADPQQHPRFLGETPVFVADVAHAFLQPLTITHTPPIPSQWVVNGDLQQIDANGAYGWHKGVFYGGADKGTFATFPEEHALALTNTTEALWQSWPVPVMPAERYRLTVEILTKEATGENDAQILFLGGPGWSWLGGPTTESVTGSTNGWRTFTLEGVVPKEADFLRVNLVSKGNTGLVLFRNIRLQRVP